MEYESDFQTLFSQGKSFKCNTPNRFKFSK